MITLTRFDGTRLVVNADLIEFIEATPDTIISLTTGRKLIVQESPQAVVEAVAAYKRQIACGPKIVEKNAGKSE